MHTATCNVLAGGACIPFTTCHANCTSIAVFFIAGYLFCLLCRFKHFVFLDHISRIMIMYLHKSFAPIGCRCMASCLPASWQTGPWRQQKGCRVLWMQ